MKICTGKGDNGITSLAGGQRVPKYHSRLEASGTVDELISWVGLLRDFRENEARKDQLFFIQDQLMRCAVTLATEAEANPEAEKLLPDKDSISLLEREIDRMEAGLPVLRNFMLPGGNILISYCHIARCVCRRAERKVWMLNNTENIPAIIPRYLNRLSDYLFLLSRQISLELDNKEIKWPI